LQKNESHYQVLGSTVDDAAGEAFDKVAKLLELPYPGGPEISKLAEAGQATIDFPRPMINAPNFDFSFSGLKTAVLREVQKQKNLDDQTIKDLSRATQDAIIDVLTKKTLKAAQQYKVKSVLLSGGVAANETLQNQFLVLSSQFPVNFFAPAKKLCTDNAAMIAAAAYFIYKPVPWDRITANPELYFEAEKGDGNSYI
jgi:N6-L-threonylcarbamoyladenine synthase